ncbi:MAG: hypothetical protein ACLFP4_02650 [Spirochaetales bacterium]
MNWLLSLYIGATVFGAGITLIDLMGVLGGEQADGEADADGEIDGDADAADDAGGEHPPSVLGHDRRRPGDRILALLSLLRTLVYFCLGFGPVGWFAVATGEALGATLAWSFGAGVVVLIGAKILRRLLRSELSSSIKESDLLFERGSITVTIMPGRLGKARIKLGNAYIDRYARATDAEARITTGTEVQVVELGPDGIVVEELP